jgi:hypothetical protein
LEQPLAHTLASAGAIGVRIAARITGLTAIANAYDTGLDMTVPQCALAPSLGVERDLRHHCPARARPATITAFWIADAPC